jgi:hypothetical protein
VCVCVCVCVCVRVRVMKWWMQWQARVLLSGSFTSIIPKLLADPVQFTATAVTKQRNPRRAGTDCDTCVVHVRARGSG